MQPTIVHLSPPVIITTDHANPSARFLRPHKRYSNVTQSAALRPNRLNPTESKTAIAPILSHGTTTSNNRNPASRKCSVSVLTNCVATPKRRCVSRTPSPTTTACISSCNHATNPITQSPCTAKSVCSVSMAARPPDNATTHCGPIVFTNSLSAFLSETCAGRTVKLGNISPGPSHS